MSVFSNDAYDHHEQVVFGEDRASGLRAIISRPLSSDSDDDRNGVGMRKERCGTRSFFSPMPTLKPPTLTRLPRARRARRRRDAALVSFAPGSSSSSDP